VLLFMSYRQYKSIRAKEQRMSWSNIN